MANQDTTRKTFHLRLPPDLFTRIAALATQDYRSINEQIVWMLQQAADELERERNTDAKRDT